MRGLSLAAVAELRPRIFALDKLAWFGLGAWMVLGILQWNVWGHTRLIRSVKLRIIKSLKSNFFHSKNNIISINTSI